MIKKTIIQKRQENYLILILALLSLILSNIALPWTENPNSMPNYFIALIVIFIVLDKANLNLFKLFTIGLLVDLFLGQILGQYAFIFISIYALNFLVGKILIIKSKTQILSLCSFITLFSFFILWATSQSHDVIIPLGLLFNQYILTLFILLILKFTINIFTTK
tara:strand:+ start:336 stop:827 length:492 start_codon:yes stop_codon:yes gene_type:complete